MTLEASLVIDFDKRVIRYGTVDNDVYQLQAAYSYLKNYSDEAPAGPFRKIMDYNTPTQYKLLNDWFFDDGDGSEIRKHFTGGSILVDNTDVYKIYCDVTTDWDPADLGDVITDDASDIGPLLAYKNDTPENGESIIYVRDINAHGVIADGSAMAGAGVGSATSNGPSQQGNYVWGNLYTDATLSSFPTVQPQSYITRADPDVPLRRIIEWSDISHWTRGFFDVVLPTMEAGVLVADGEHQIFTRQGRDSFAGVSADLTTTTAGDRTARAFSTSDLDGTNDTLAEHYILIDASNAGSFTAGDIISDSDGTNPPTWHAEVVAVVDSWNTDANYLLSIVGLRGTITDNDTVYVSTVSEGTINGSPGSAYFTHAGTDFTTLGQELTGSVSLGQALLRGTDNVTAVSYVVYEPNTALTGATRNEHYIDLTTGDTVTGASEGSAVPTAVGATLVSGFSDVTVVIINGTVTTGGITGTPVEGEVFTHAEGQFIFVQDNSGTVTLGNADNWNTDTNLCTGAISGATFTPSQNIQLATSETFAFAQQSAFAYNVFVEGGSIYNTGRTIPQIYQYLKLVLRDGAGMAGWGPLSSFGETMYRTILDASVPVSFNEVVAVFTDETTDINSATADDVAPIPAAPATNDAIYFGADFQFQQIEIDMGIAGAGTWTILWEYWDGTAWSSLGNVTDPTTGWTAGTATYVVDWDKPTDWDTYWAGDTSLSQRGRYWVRARVSAFTSITTQPFITQAWIEGVYDVDGQEYRYALDAYAPGQPDAPFGFRAGSDIYGAQGVWIEGMATSDANAVHLFDTSNTLQEPFTSVTITINNTASLDWVDVFESAGASSEVVKDDTFTGHATLNVLSGSTVEIDEAIPTDTPSAGSLYIKDVTGVSTRYPHHRYRYLSWTGSIFTLAAEITGSATGSSTGNNLEDTTSQFGSGVQRGDAIRNTTTGEYAFVAEVTDVDNLVTTPGITWTSTDNYEINSLWDTYDGTNTVYTSFLSEEASGTTTSGSILFLEITELVAKVRRAAPKSSPIRDYVSPAQLTTGGATFQTVRDPDTVAT